MIHASKITIKTTADIIVYVSYLDYTQNPTHIVHSSSISSNTEIVLSQTKATVEEITIVAISQSNIGVDIYNGSYFNYIKLATIPANGRMLINASGQYIYGANGVLLSSNAGGAGSGDMLKSIYDTNDDGVVNDSEMLGGRLPNSFANATDIVSLGNSITAEEDARIIGDANTLSSANTNTTNAINQLINGASVDYNTLLKIENKINAINSIIGSSSPDVDSIVNTVSELMVILNSYPEGTNLLNLIGTKINTADIVNNLTSTVAGFPLDSTQGKALKDLIDALTTTVAGKANTSHSHSISDITNLSTELAGKANTTHTHTASEISDFSTTVNGLNSATTTSINGKISQGTNVTITGSGTNASPYVISSTASGGGAGDAIIANGLQQFTGSTMATLTNQTSTPTSPSAGQSKIYVKDIAGNQTLSLIEENGEVRHMQASMSFNRFSAILPGATTAPSVVGCAITSVGTISHPTPATTSRKTAYRRFTNTSAATAGALASNRVNVLECVRGNALEIGGFTLVVRFSLTTLQAGMRMFAGLSTTATTAPTNVDPTTVTTDGKIGMAINSNTGNWNIVHNNSGTAPTVIALGANFPVNNTDVLELVLYCPPNSTSVKYRVKNITTGNETSGTITTNLPLNTAYMGRTIWATNNATAAAVAYDVNCFTLETDS